MKMLKLEALNKQYKEELDSIPIKHKSEVEDLKQRIKRLTKEKQELHDIVKDRDFQLLSLKNENCSTSFSNIQTKLLEIDNNLSSVLNEKDLQLNSMKKVLDSIKNMYEDSQKHDSKGKLRVKHKRNLYTMTKAVSMDVRKDMNYNSARGVAPKRTGFGVSNFSNIITEEVLDTSSNRNSSTKSQIKLEQPPKFDEDGFKRFLEKTLANFLSKHMQEPKTATNLNFQTLVKTITEKLRKDRTEFQVIKCSTSEASRTKEVDQKQPEKECQTILTIPTNFKNYKSVLLKYMTTTYVKGKNIDIPSGENLDKILKLINRYMSSKKKGKGKYHDTYTVMTESNIFKLMESLFSDKVFQDIENAKNNVKIDIPDFVVDQMIMKFGLKTIAVKNLISLRLGLQEIVKKAVHKSKGVSEQNEIIEEMSLTSKHEDLRFPYA